MPAEGALRRPHPPPPRDGARPRRLDEDSYAWYATQLHIRPSVHPLVLAVCRDVTRVLRDGGVAVPVEVAIATAMQCGIPVAEYSPRKVKQSITGSGAAGSEGVAGNEGAVASVVGGTRGGSVNGGGATAGAPPACDTPVCGGI